MSTYRKKPIVVEAHRWLWNGDHPDDGDPETEGDVVRYFRHPHVDGQAKCRECNRIFHDHGWIDTLEGGHRVCPTDWIITGVRGERYPCKEAIFRETYESVIEVPAEAADARVITLKRRTYDEAMALLAGQLVATQTKLIDAQQELLAAERKLMGVRMALDEMGDDAPKSCIQAIRESVA